MTKKKIKWRTIVSSLVVTALAIAAMWVLAWQLAGFIDPKSERAFGLFGTMFGIAGTVGICGWRAWRINVELKKRGKKVFDPETATQAEFYREARAWAFGFKAETKEKTATDENGNEILDENGEPRKRSYRVFNVGKGVGYLKTVAEKGGALAVRAEADLAFLVRRGYEDALPNPQEALQRAEKPAKKGNPFALYVLGRLYGAGEGGLEKDEKKANKYFEQARQGLLKIKGDPFATNLLGRFYDKAWGVPRDEKKAAEYYAAAANAGYADGKNRLALCLSDGVGQIENKAKAVELFAEAADEGHLGAKVNLGRAYAAGLANNECESDATDEKAKRDAFKLFEEAAAAGSDEARNALGECFLYGDGVKADPEKAREYFEKAAEQGLADAILNLGRCWYNGRGGDKDTAKGVELYRSASDKGNDVATTRLGRCYYYGEGVTRDEEEAARCFRKAADAGNSLAAYLLGNYLFETGDKENAIKYYEAASAKGRVEATMKLAFCYRYGDGVERDEKKAREKYAEAAKANHVVGMFVYALCWRGGFGGEQSDSEARKWFERAARAGHKQATAYTIMFSAQEGATEDEAQKEEAKEQARALREKACAGDADAWCKLGDVYLFGDGVEQGWREAIAAYKRAANKRCVAATMRLAVCYLRFADEAEKAVSWFKKAADLGRSDAMFALSGCYYAGQGVAPNPATAFEWLRKAAEFGNPVAMCALARRYENGEDVEPDPAKATRWYRKAADYGEADAMFALASRYERGDEGEADPTQAARWYRMAADYGSAAAMRKLGFCFENGFGVEANPDEAARWRRMANDWEPENNEATLFADAEAAVEAATVAAPEIFAGQAANETGASGGSDASANDAEPEAAALYRRASAGDAQAAFELGGLYAQGRGGVEQSWPNACRCYRKAANAGLTEAANALAWLLETGRGGVKNVVEALSWYRRAAEAGDEYAAQAVARLTRANPERR